MVILMPAEEEPLQVQQRDQMIGPGRKWRHTIVERVFRLEGQLMISMDQGCGNCDGATAGAVRRYLPKGRIAFRNRKRTSLVVNAD